MIRTGHRTRTRPEAAIMKEARKRIPMMTLMRTMMRTMMRTEVRHQTNPTIERTLQIKHRLAGLGEQADRPRVAT